MRLEDPLELGFLQFTASLLGGHHPGPPTDRLLPFERGLTRDEAGGLPVRRALEAQVARAGLRFLARHGGLAPDRYVVDGRRVRGALLLAPLVRGLAPLRYGEPALRVLVRAHDGASGEAAGRVLAPAGLGDMLVFHLVATGMGEATPRVVLAASPLTAWITLEPGEAAGRVRDAMGDPGCALVFRALREHAARSGARRLAGVLGLPPEKQGARLADASLVLGAAYEGARRTGRFSLLLSLARTWDVFLREHRTPEELLAETAQKAARFRTVREQEAFLAAWAGVFAPAPKLLGEVERIQRLAFVEREEEEKLLFDEVQAGPRGALARAAGLHAALARTLA